jgi:hypothetical protein
MEKEDYKNVKKYEILICDDCMNLKGEMCHNPVCCFCRNTMEEVANSLETTGITARCVGYKQEGRKVI